MIPQFPSFKKIELSDRADVEAHTDLFEPYSDFNFTCLWIWDTDGKRMISQLNGNLVVLFTDYMTSEPFLSFLGTRDCEDTAKTLIDYCKVQGLPTTLRLMPDVSISGISVKAFTIEESPGDFDYVLSTKKLALLAGTQFQQKRGRANKFWREKPLAKLARVDLSDQGVRMQLFETIRAWVHLKNTMKKDYEVAHELTAIKRFFESDLLDSAIGVALFSGDIMLGFAIAEKLANGFAMGHFSKSIISYKGVTEALMQGNARYLVSLQIDYLNFESDLGFENMRESKMSWRPVKFLKRYNVRYAQA